LTLADFEKLCAASCAWCGETPSLGVDRIDSRIGYVQTASVQNCQSLCGFCNRWKSNLPQQVCLTHAAKIAAYQEKLRKQKLAVLPQVAA